MQQSRIQLALGKPSGGSASQWIEALITVERESDFAFQADLCRIATDESYSQYRVDAVVGSPLSAELALALLAMVAEPPFTPTAGGLSVSKSGENQLANHAVLRMLQPEVRADIRTTRVPSDTADILLRKLDQASKSRKLQSLFLTPGSFD